MNPWIGFLNQYGYGAPQMADWSRTASADPWATTPGAAVDYRTPPIVDPDDYEVDNEGGAADTPWGLMTGLMGKSPGGLNPLFYAQPLPQALPQPRNQLADLMAMAGQGGQRQYGDEISIYQNPVIQRLMKRGLMG